jgi:hypothetical protein
MEVKRAYYAWMDRSLMTNLCPLLLEVVNKQRGQVRGGTGLNQHARVSSSSLYSLFNRVLTFHPVRLTAESGAELPCKGWVQLVTYLNATGRLTIVAEKFFLDNKRRNSRDDPERDEEVEIII